MTLDFEKLGAFYLGREVDPGSGEATGNLLLCDSRDLTTHGVIIGMTGSGKTGLLRRSCGGSRMGPARRRCAPPS
jgi:hypothetical protein